MRTRIFIAAVCNRKTKRMVKTQTSIYRMESKYNTNGILYYSENKSYILPTSMNLKKKKKH